MKCINCGRDNPENNAFCSYCGNQLPIQPVNQPNMTNTTTYNNISNQNIQAQGITPTTIQQPNLNQNIQPINNNYNMNNTQNIPNYNETPSTNKSSKKNIIIIVSIIAAIVVLVTLAFTGKFFYDQYKLKQADKELQDEIKDFGTLDPIEGNDEQETKYTTGQSVTLVDGSSWYVISETDNNVTLLSTENYGEPTYFSSKSNYYDESIVKDIIENQFLPTLKSSIETNGGNTTNLSARIISIEDIRTILNISSSVETTDIEISGTYKWLFETGSYWTSTHSESDIYNSVYIVESWNSFGTINEDIAGSGLSNGNKFNIRPIIETDISNIK